jgi:tetratricopeptide (TPR) repeat protein
MSGPVHRRLTGRWRLAFILTLLTIIGFSGYSTGRSLWAEYHLRAARRALERREFARARQHLAVCLEVWPAHTETHLLAAQTTRRARDYREADRLLTTYRKLGGAPEAIRLEQALAQAQRGQFAEVEGPLWALVQDDPSNAPLALESLAQGYMQVYHWAKALNCLGLLLERQPEDAEVLTWRGWVWENMRQIPEALKDYRRAVELNPEHNEARLRLAEALLQSNLPQEALRHLEWVQEQQPTNPALLLGLFRCLQALNRPEEARRVLDQFSPQQMETAPVLTERGKLALSLGQTAEAEAWLRQALVRAPYERETNYQMVLCLYRAGKTDEAKVVQTKLKQIEADIERLERLFTEMVKDPRALSVRYEAGRILLDNGQDQDGLRLLQGVLEEDARHVPTHQALAKYFARIGDGARARYHAQFIP